MKNPTLHSYKVTKDFIFRGTEFKHGSVFDPREMQCNVYKLGILIRKRFLDQYEAVENWKPADYVPFKTLNIDHGEAVKAADNIQDEEHVNEVPLPDLGGEEDKEASDTFKRRRRR